MKTVLVDTNIVLWTFDGGADFVEALQEVAPGFDVAIPKCVVSELEKLGSKESKAALKYCEKMNIIDIGSGYADEMLLNASAKGYVIATNDKHLLDKLAERDLTAIRIRGKKRLMATGSESL